MSSAPTPSPWPAIWLLYAAGLLAAAQLGKFAALAPAIAQELALSLPAVALAISLVEVGGATLGLVAGRLAGRAGLAPTLRAGLLALAAAGAGQALAPGAPALFGLRLLEAAGYLAVIVSAPVLIVQAAAPAGARVQALAMTLWSTFVPAGLALGAWSSAALASSLGSMGLPGWRGAVAAWAACAAVVALATWWLGPSPQAAQASTAEDAPPAAVPRRAVGLALGFGGFAVFQIGLLGLLPTLLVSRAGLDAAAAGGWTAVASLSALAGSAVAARWMQHGDAGLRLATLLSLGLPPLLLFAVFTDRPVLALALSSAIAISALGGIFASLTFALLPRLAPERGALVRANGWLAQCGASGSLLGPPLMAATVQAGGWTAAAVLGLAVSLMAIPLVWPAVARPLPASA
jgi:MFS transporter, CP family, cyanate transporter